MKITRHSIEENYNTTAEWINDFSKELEKQAYNMDYLKDLFDKRRGFSSIDEKMADIKERIGFELVMKVSKEIDELEEVKVASNPGDVKIAECKHPEDSIRKMNNILKYINDMIAHESHVVDSASVISRCRDEENLGFGDLGIDLGKLVEHIDKLIGSNRDSDVDDVVYTPNEPIPSGEVADNVADYYNHAEPQSS